MLACDLRAARAFHAPRSLNEPVVCTPSSLENTCARASSLSARFARTGVTATTPASRISAAVGSWRQSIARSAAEDIEDGCDDVRPVALAPLPVGAPRIADHAVAAYRVDAIIENRGER